MDKKPTATYKIVDTFKITGRGLVFGGEIIDGQISVGDFIEFPVANKTRRKKITAIESARSIHPDRKTGLLIKCDDDAEIDEIRNSPPNNMLALIYKADT